MPKTPQISSITLIDLTPGKQTWLRVAGVNAAGQGAWCDPVGRMIS